MLLNRHWRKFQLHSVVTRRILGSERTQPTTETRGAHVSNDPLTSANLYEPPGLRNSSIGGFVQLAHFGLALFNTPSNAGEESRRRVKFRQPDWELNCPQRHFRE